MNVASLVLGPLGAAFVVGFLAVSGYFFYKWRVLGFILKGVAALCCAGFLVCLLMGLGVLPI